MRVAAGVGGAAQRLSRPVEAEALIDVRDVVRDVVWLTKVTGRGKYVDIVLDLPPGAVLFATWGGLRGAISLIMAQAVITTLGDERYAAHSELVAAQASWSPARRTLLPMLRCNGRGLAWRPALLGDHPGCLPGCRWASGPPCLCSPRC